MSDYSRPLDSKTPHKVLRDLSKRLKRARGYILVVQDEDGVVRCEHDLSRCSREGDLRDVALRDVVHDSEGLVFHINDQHAKSVALREEEEKVAAYKSKRSQELSGEV